MILEIAYSNIRAFREETLFSMEASDSVEKGDNVMMVELSEENARVLKVGAIYGPNASGKTTVIYALYALKEWLLNQPYHFSSDIICPFLLDENSRERPSEISVKFIAGNQVMRYCVAFHKDKCCKEQLFIERNDECEILFNRLVSGNGNHTVNYGVIFRDTVMPAWSVSPNASVLALFNSLDVRPISEAARFLTTIGIANSYNSYMMRLLFAQLRPWLNKEGNRRRLVEFENCFDINIKDIKIPQKPESTNMDIKYVHSVVDKDGKIKKDSEFKAELESTGTNVLTVLGAKVLQALDEGRPLLVDEFDSCFHTEVTRIVIDMFRDPDINKKGAQLILTTHNVALMNEHVLRKDQVWFIEKQNDRTSQLFSLSEFDEVSEFTPFAAWYLAKRFGAMPNPNLLKIRGLFKNDK